MKRRSPCKILVIEPLRENQILLSEILEVNDFNVDIVDNVDDGIENAFRNQYHIVICQNVLPGSSGLNVYKSVRHNLAQTGTAFFLLLNRIENRDFFKGLELGIDNFIEFPVNKDILISKIRNQIEKSRAFDVFETEKFKDYFNTSPIAMFIIEENEIVEINNSFRDLFRGHWKNLHNSNFYDILKFGGEPKNISKYYKLKKGFRESCILNNIRLIDSFILNFEIFLYKSNSNKKGKIFAEIMPSGYNEDNIAKPNQVINERVINQKVDEFKSNHIHRKVNFTDREFEIYQLSAQGLPIKQIASRLGLSKRTIEKHRQNIMRKTNAHNIIEAILYVQEA
jgi:two-component system alkaline phosphatase synthesis response regulator PhoP